jgi:hypothetical protein
LAEFGIDQPDLMAIVDQGSPDGEQAERRQMIIGNSATDRGMRHIHQQDGHDRRLPLASEARFRL